MALDYELEKDFFKNEIKKENIIYTGFIRYLGFNKDFDLKGSFGFNKEKIFSEDVFEKRKKPAENFFQKIWPNHENVKVGQKENSEEIIRYNSFIDNSLKSYLLILDNEGKFSDYKETLIERLAVLNDFAVSMELLDILFNPIERQILGMYEKYKNIIPSTLKKTV